MNTNELGVHVLSPENCDIDILDNGRTVKDVIDNKIKELGPVVSIGDIVSLKFFRTMTLCVIV